MTTLAILGASGDLARRLVLPALFRLDRSGRLPDLRIVGFGLERWDDDGFRERVRQGLEAQGRDTAGAWQRFARRLVYHPLDLDGRDLGALPGRIEGPALFHLALPPGAFGHAAERLGEAGLADETHGWRRLVVEKPFGHDLKSALGLDAQLHRYWREDQILRMDHYLGKETVQNVLVFRFANSFAEPLLNGRFISQVQITVAQTLGLEGRWRYYDGIGALRDMLQNHLMQLFTLTAMEPPAVWDAGVLRDHKVEVLRAVRAIEPGSVADCAARGRYAAGEVEGRAVPGYREEEGVPADSNTETFAALRLHVDNWRWAGTPFYLRSGKRMGADLSEVALQFREPPRRLFREHGLEPRGPNWLVFRLRPDESIDLVAHARRPGPGLESRPVTLHAPYATRAERETSAYEQLLLDALSGDPTSFLRFDEVESSWRLLQPVLDAWSGGEPESYAAGSTGPAAQDRILLPGHRWRPVGG